MGLLSNLFMVKIKLFSRSFGANEKPLVMLLEPFSWVLAQGRVKKGSCSANEKPRPPLVMLLDPVSWSLAQGEGG